MPIEISADLPSELVPLAWLIGTWEGEGVVGYADTPERQFRQRVEFIVPDGAPYLQYLAHAWLVDEPASEQQDAHAADASPGDGQQLAAETTRADSSDSGKTHTLTVETGIWQLVRQREDFDAGPGLLVPQGDTPYTSAEAVEKLRNDDGDFELEVGIVQPNGIMELYAGRVAGPRIDLATDAVARTKTAKDYRASTRMYGLVQGDLLWAWDIAALGHEMASHASARLKKVS